MGSWKIEDGFNTLRDEFRPKTAGYKKTWCNVYGGENAGPSDVRNMGGLGRPPDQKGDTNWFCDTVSVGRFYMMCEHGHKGQPMDLCAKHAEKYSKIGKDGLTTVQFCPRCNTDPPGHRCQVRLHHVS